MATQKESYKCQRCNFTFHHNSRFVLRCSNCGELRALLRLKDVSSKRIVDELKQNNGS